MPAPLPIELRERVIDAVEIDGLTYAQAAESFRIGEASVSRWLRRHRDGRLPPTPAGRPQGGIIGPAELEVLKTIVLERPEDTVVELRDQFEHATGLSVSRATVSRAIQRLGFSRKKRVLKLQSDTQNVSSK